MEGYTCRKYVWHIGGKRRISTVSQTIPGCALKSSMENSSCHGVHTCNILRLLSRSAVFLRLAVRALGGKVLAEPGIVWGEEAEDNVVPDLAIVLPDRLHLASGPALSGTPNIAIEVVSESSRTIDYIQKRYLYERTGAQEYWIVDRFERRLEVWQFTDAPATSVSYGNADTLTTPLVPGLAIPVQDIWP